MSSDPMNEKEYRSSAWALLIVGGAGLILVVLGAGGVIPLQPGNPYLFYGVMMAIFMLFLVMGALSFKSARIFAEKAKADNTLMETVEAWCLEHLKSEEIDAAAVMLDREERSEGDDAAETAGTARSALETAEATDDGTEGTVIAADPGDRQVLYFIRCEYIKNRINSQFMNLDQMLLDRFVDERLYDLIFGEQDKS